MIGFTMIEQGRRLINAGLNQDTADMEWAHYKCTLKGGRIINAPEWYLCPRFEHLIESIETFPAWSMGRLWQILNENGIYFYEYATNDPVEKVMESLVCAVERASKQGRIKPQ